MLATRLIFKPLLGIAAFGVSVAICHIYLVMLALPQQPSFSSSLHAQLHPARPSSSIQSQIDKLIEGQSFHNKSHIMVLLGTRPEAVKLAPIVLELRRRHEVFHCTLVSTGQHESMLKQVLTAFGLGTGGVDISLNLMTTGQTLATLTSRVLESMDHVFQHIRPDMILVQGDTSTAFVGALAAFYHQIPVGHVEAGLRTHNIYAPFPEEVNRQGIGVLASIHFAATDIAAMNLLEEGKDPRSIFVTGNPVVDALQHYSPAASRALASDEGQLVEAALDQDHKADGRLYVKQIRTAMTERCRRGAGGNVFNRCRLILLTAHRRENHGSPLRNIMSAVADILETHPDVLVVYPVHLNPEVRQAVRDSVPPYVYARLWSEAEPRDASPERAMAETSVLSEGFDPFDRFLLLPPIDYQDLVRIMNMSELVLTDSGGIQEEAAVLGKAIVILRDITERPEGVLAGVARLVGTQRDAIVTETTRLLGRNTEDATVDAQRARTLYGDGQSAERIADIVKWFLTEGAATHYNTALPPPTPHFSAAGGGNADEIEVIYDLVVVLTVWKRDTLQTYLEMLSEQSLLQITRPQRTMRTNVIVFQNGNHLDVSSILQRWRTNETLWRGANVVITHVHSPMATGYYGRFLAPLLSKVRDDGYFVVCDDDVIFGARYLEAMARVVDGGSLAVRVGRFLGEETADGLGIAEHFGVTPKGGKVGMHVVNEQAVEYDFGGHIWMGRYNWIRVAWRHPPPTIITSEDFWISAVLKQYHGIGTQRPACPANDVQQCACSMQIAGDHQPVEVGGHSGGEFDVRSQAMGSIVRAYGYKPLGDDAKAREAKAYTFHEPPGEGPFKVDGTRFENCLHYV